MARLADAADRWKRIAHKDFGLKDRPYEAECDFPHPDAPGWRVWCRWVLHDDRLVLVEVRVFPNVAGYPKREDGRLELPDACVDGITMRMLRSVTLDDLFEPVQSWSQLKVSGRSAMNIRDDVFAKMAEAPNPGGGGREDRYYAQWALRIHEATVANPRSPIQQVADDTGLLRDQVRDLATAAREKGVYAPRGQGKGGGYLTEYGQRVLKQSSPKQRSRNTTKQSVTSAKPPKRKR